MDGLGDNGVLGNIGSVVRQEEVAKVILFTVFGINGGLITNSFLVLVVNAKLVYPSRQLGVFIGSIAQRTSVSSALGKPINSSSLHSKITKLANGSP